LSHLDLAIERSPFDAEDRLIARQEDRQGLGLTRKPVEPDELQPGAATAPEAAANIAGHRIG
jgi:hypothetical protein